MLDRGTGGLISGLMDSKARTNDMALRWSDCPLSGPARSQSCISSAGRLRADPDYLRLAYGSTCVGWTLTLNRPLAIAYKRNGMPFSITATAQHGLACIACAVGELILGVLAQVADMGGSA